MNFRFFIELNKWTNEWKIHLEKSNISLIIYIFNSQN